MRNIRSLKNAKLYELIAYEFQNAMVQRVENAKIAKQTRNTEIKMCIAKCRPLCSREVKRAGKSS